MTNKSATHVDSHAQPEQQATGGQNTPTHTRGPWSVGFSTGWGDNGQPISGIWIEAGPYCSIASVMPQLEARGNANLIAAAPELRELLLTAISYWQDDSRSERRRQACLSEASAMLARIDA